VPVAVAARAGWVALHKQERVNMAAEIGAVAEFWGAPKPNRANTRMFFAQRTEKGVGVFWCDLADGRTAPIFEAPDVSLVARLNKLLEWSPNDQLFAYTRQVGKSQMQEIALCSGDSGREVATVRLPGKRCAVTAFTWLSPVSFAYFNCERELRVIERVGNDWKITQSFTELGKEAKRDLCALSSRAVAWREGQTIRMYRLDDTEPTSIWQPSGKQTLVDCSYSSASRTLLLNCGENERGGDLLRFQPEQPAMRQAIVGKPWETVFKVSWIDQEKGFAYLAARRIPRHLNDAWTPYKSKTLFVQAGDSPAPVQVLGKEEVIDYTASGNRIYVVGSMTNEPSAIWEYAVETGGLRRIVAGAPPFQRAQTADVRVITTTNDAGQRLRYHVWPPVGTASGRKYPLIIGHTPYRWLPEAVVAANSQCFFVSAHRAEWSDDVDGWAEEVLATYADLLRRFPIDTNRVFLFGTSAETSALSGLLAARPELWKGAILQGPGALPRLSEVKISRLLIIAGEQERGARKRLAAYQNEAARYAIPVTVAFREGPHVWTATSTAREHAVHLAQFLTHETP
jgi:hypothetical protein